MIGYEIPAPGWFSDPGVYADPTCPAGAQAQTNPSADIGQHNNYHKLGVFMDFDGPPQPGPNINTRGMLVTNPDHGVTRYFIDPYPTLAGTSPARRWAPPSSPRRQAHRCCW